MSSAPTRPVLKWFGAKWLMAPRILPYFPAHRVYVEPFGGGGSVLMRKPRSRIEVYNDLDSGLVNVFRVLRDPATAEQLKRATWLTPFSRAEHELTYEPTDEPVEAARRFIFRSFASFGSSAHVRKRTGFRSKDNAAGQHSAVTWAGWPLHVDSFCERLRGVVIENRPAVDVIRMHDGPDTLLYVDPPYMLETRKPGASGDYNHDMTEDGHRELGACLNAVAGSVVLSGYRCPLYDEMFAGWRRVDFKHYSGGCNAPARGRIESIWLNERACVDGCVSGPLAKDLFTNSED